MRMTEAEFAAIKRRQATVMPIRSVDLILPFPPSVNHSIVGFHRGGKKTAYYTAFMEAVMRLVAEQGSPRLEGRLRLSVALSPPTNRKRIDIDNRLKAVCDSLEKSGVFENDEQIDDLRIRRMPPTKEGSAVVTIERMA